MTQVTQLLTAEGLLAMPEDGYLYELVRGELLKMSPSGQKHGKIAGKLVMYLAPFVQKNQLGEVYTADAGFVLSRNPDTVRAPDVAFVRREAIEKVGDPDGYWPGAPDLAIEVVSPSDRYSEIEEKVEDYVRAGTSAVWVVDPSRKTVTIRSKSTVSVLGENDTLDGGDVVPGFRCPVRDLFA